jgi:hypothetical protein
MVIAYARNILLMVIELANISTYLIKDLQIYYYSEFFVHSA